MTIENLPPELDDAVRGFVDRLDEVRTRLIRRESELDDALDDSARRGPAPRPHDPFDLDHPISSSVEP
ncbi:hypothetical protein [Actinophytocola xinjiangensis]|nr:hypothetical protein [Actinophytocola xinjiangensis]